MQIQHEVLDNLVRRILAVTHPVKVLLFGSAARDEMTAESDLDVLVIVSDGADKHTTAKAIYRNLIGFPIAVDVVVVGESELESNRDNFSLVYYPALREGQEIYAA